MLLGGLDVLERLGWLEGLREVAMIVNSVSSPMGLISGLKDLETIDEWTLIMVELQFGKLACDQRGPCGRISRIWA